MRVRTMLAPVLILGASTSMAAQQEVPAALHQLKSHQIVEAVSAEQGRSLHLTSAQIRQLDSLHVAVRSEPHKYERRPSLKAHQNVRMKPMISRRRAYADAMVILAPKQRTQLEAVFNDPAYRLPDNLEAKGAQEEAGDPLQHHGAGAAPRAQATGDSVADPLQHHKGAAAPPEQIDTGKTAPKPLEHKP